MLIRRLAVAILLSNAVVSAFAPSGSNPFRERKLLQSNRKHGKDHRGACCLSIMTKDDDSELMKNEIKEMRKEALRRIEALNSQVVEEHEATSSLNDKSASTTTAIGREASVSRDKARHHKSALHVTPPEKSLSEDTSTTNRSCSFEDSVKTQLDELSLLHGTCWKLVFNIGREEARSLLPENAPTTRSGTWMPKTWGVSGERLLMSLEVEFKPDKLDENEEFLNGISGAKVLHVVNQELTLGPSLTEGRRKFPVSNGGWRVCKGEGPLGTDILRFFFRVAEEVSHRGSDVYCPAGKVFCSCGYFPQRATRNFSKSTRETLREKQESLNRRYEQLSREVQDDTNLLSWDKIVKTKELLQLRVEAGMLAERVNEARVREPDKNLLRLSPNFQVGLTREGGVCCKVPKGLFTEYQILGKFGLKAVAKEAPSEL